MQGTCAEEIMVQSGTLGHFPEGIGPPAEGLLYSATLGPGVAISQPRKGVAPAPGARNKHYTAQTRKARRKPLPG